MRNLVLLLALVLAGCSAAPDRLDLPLDAPPPEGTFDWSDAEAFGWSDRFGGGLALKGRADYAPPHRSPLAIALLDGVEFRSFELEADLLQSGREYGHRDLCLFLGFEAPDRFYYVHMATTPDQNAHNVFLVDGAPRRNLIAPRERGVDWGQEEWHHVKLVRDVDAGTIRVWFDDMETPVLEAEDRTLEWGRVGFGSFDDEGMIRNLQIRSAQSRPVGLQGSPFGG